MVEIHSPEINIQVISTCHLSCPFCPRTWAQDADQNGIMSIETFEIVLKQCVDAGKTHVCLTPTMGEPFLDPTFLDKLWMLEHAQSIESFFFATNLIEPGDDEIKMLSGLSKLHMEVSLYGHDVASYACTTNSDLQIAKLVFRCVLENLKRLAEQSPQLTVFIRWDQKWDETFPPGLMRAALKVLESKGARVSDEETHNFNLGGLIPEGTLENEHPPREKHGVCPTALAGYVAENGDFGLCYMNDPYRITRIGNVWVTPLKELINDKRRVKILREMSRDKYSGMCLRCNEIF